MKILIELAYFNILYPNLSFGIEKRNKKFLDSSPKHWTECSYNYTGLIA